VKGLIVIVNSEKMYDQVLESDFKIVGNYVVIRHSQSASVKFFQCFNDDGTMMDQQEGVTI
jgi:hypothetical protein